MDRFAGSIFSTMGTYISLIGALVALMMIWPKIVLVMILAGAAIVLLVEYFDGKIVKLIKLFNTKDHKVNSLLVDYISNIRTLLTLRFLSPTEQTVADAIDYTYDDRNKEIKLTEWKWFLTSALLGLVLTGCIFYYIYDVWSSGQVVVVGTIMMIYQYIERVSNSFYNMTSTYSTVVQASANTAAVQDILDTYHTLESKPHLTIADWQQCQIQHLSFSYDEKKIFSDLDFGFKRGEKIACIGESGSGKSTILSLLRGLYEPSYHEV